MIERAACWSGPPPRSPARDVAQRHTPSTVSVSVAESAERGVRGHPRGRRRAPREVHGEEDGSEPLHPQSMLLETATPGL